MNQASDGDFELLVRANGECLLILPYLSSRDPLRARARITPTDLVLTYGASGSSVLKGIATADLQAVRAEGVLRVAEVSEVNIGEGRSGVQVERSYRLPLSVSI